MNRDLTMTEEVVYALVLKGRSNQEIADEMGIKEKTVKFHITHIYKKCGVKSRAQMMAKALNGELII